MNPVFRCAVFRWLLYFYFLVNYSIVLSFMLFFSHFFTHLILWRRYRWQKERLDCFGKSRRRWTSFSTDATSHTTTGSSLGIANVETDRSCISLACNSEKSNVAKLVFTCVGRMIPNVQIHPPSPVIFPAQNAGANVTSFSRPVLARVVV